MKHLAKLAPSIFPMMCALAHGQATAPAGAIPPQPGPWSAEVDGIRARVTPAEDPFPFGAVLRLNVEVENTSQKDISLVVFQITAPNAVIKYAEGEPTSQAGMPCRMVLVGNRGGLNRLNDTSGRTTMTLAARQRLVFTLAISALDSRQPVPSGVISAQVQIDIGAPGKSVPLYLPAIEARFIDAAAVKTAVAELEKLLADPATPARDIEQRLLVLSEQPDPAAIPVLLQANQLPKKNSFMTWYIWKGLQQFQDERVAKAALDAYLAKDLSNDSPNVRQMLEVLERNRKYLNRESALKTAEHPGILELATKEEGPGYETMLILAEYAEAQDLPKLAEFVARINRGEGNLDVSGENLRRVRRAFLKYPDAAKPVLREVMSRAKKPGEFAPWTHTFTLRLPPPGLLLVGDLLSELRDDEAIDLFEYFGKSQDRQLEGVKAKVVGWLAAIDDAKALQALRAIAPSGIETRAKLGDPTAVDAVLEQAKKLRGSREDDTGESTRLFQLVASLGAPKGQDVEAWWRGARPQFVAKFQGKYGFAPE